MSAAIMRGTVLASSALLLTLAPVALFALGPPEAIVAQKNRLFSPTAISVPAGGIVRFTNDDAFLHQIFVSSPSFSFESDEQAPGQSIDVRFTQTGEFQVLCGIHPKMSLKVQVR